MPLQQVWCPVFPVLLANTRPGRALSVYHAISTRLVQTPTRRHAPSAPLARRPQEKLDQINHWLQQAQVHSKQQERLVQSNTPLQVSQMLAYDGRASAGGGAGAVILVISETKDFGSLTGNDVANFLGKVIPHLQRGKVTGITNTKMYKSLELVPQAFELKLNELDMTPELRGAMKERSITIAGKECTWGLRRGGKLRR